MSSIGSVEAHFIVRGFGSFTFIRGGMELSYTRVNFIGGHETSVLKLPRPLPFVRGRCRVSSR